MKIEDSNEMQDDDPVKILGTKQAVSRPQGRTVQNTMNQYDFFVAIFTDGLMNLEELRSEAQVQNWAPVFVLKTSEGIVVPMFRDPQTCLNFIKRNAPKGQMVGIMGMSEVDTKRFTDKGWKIDWHTYPKLYTNRPGFEIVAEVIESDFELYVKGKR